MWRLRPRRKLARSEACRASPVSTRTAREWAARQTCRRRRTFPHQPRSVRPQVRRSCRGGARRATTSKNPTATPTGGRSSATRRCSRSSSSARSSSSSPRAASRPPPTLPRSAQNSSGTARGWGYQCRSQAVERLAKTGDFYDVRHQIVHPARHRAEEFGVILEKHVDFAATRSSKQQTPVIRIRRHLPSPPNGELQ
jgi:hypothetical protein